MSKKMDDKPQERTRAELLAVVKLKPNFSAARIITSCAGSMDEMQTIDSLQEMNDALDAGDMKTVEAMLLCNAHSLQAIFEKFAVKMNQAEYTDQLVTYSKIALRAQNQMRQTLATLIEAKNPKRATFIKQQHNTLNQQINEAEIPEKEINPANQLLEEKDGQRLDTGKKGANVEDDSQMETVGAVHRTEDS